MIDSCYWRAEIRNDLIWLRKKRKYKRWSEKQSALFERKLMIVAFQVRSLLEHSKVNDQARETCVPVLRYKKNGHRPFTNAGAGWPEDRFDMGHPEPHTLSALEVCNQLIHYYWMQTITEGTSFASMLVFSDYQRHKWAYEIRIDDVLKFFHKFSDESSAITNASYKWCDKKQDYLLIKASGSE
ncbi:hypothetical protein [Pseudomonas jessenii]|uniref:hypothetical protein n=1 Tax=Pseudomonas jessenii TaxID=77298 RepID=UPI0032E41600